MYRHSEETLKPPLREVSDIWDPAASDFHKSIAWLRENVPKKNCCFFRFWANWIFFFLLIWSVTHSILGLVSISFYPYRQVVSAWEGLEAESTCNKCFKIYYQHLYCSRRQIGTDHKWWKKWAAQYFYILRIHSSSSIAAELGGAIAKDFELICRPAFPSHTPLPVYQSGRNSFSRGRKDWWS